MNINKGLIKNKLVMGLVGTTLTVTAMFASHVQADELQTLRNLERERAILIETMLDADLNSEKRQAQIEHSVRRLVDLERMVLRDSRLEGNTDTLVRRAFNNYDLTFLAHASMESKQSIVGHWFDQVGLSNNDILSSNMRSK